MNSGADEQPNEEAEEPILVQRKATIFRMLTVLWILPSLTSLFVFWYQFRPANGLGSILRNVAIEQWLCVLLVLMHPIFAFLSWHYRKSEPFTQILPDEPQDTEK